jgi:hypothetical protein
MDDKPAFIETFNCYCAMAILAVAHALTVLFIWLAMFKFNSDWVSGKTWVVFAWFWLVWPLILALHPARSTRRLVIPLGISILLFLPCAPTIAAFTAWSIGGFAP